MELNNSKWKILIYSTAYLYENNKVRHFKVFLTFALKFYVISFSL